MPRWSGRLLRQQLASQRSSGTDQGSQFTSQVFLDTLRQKQTIQISMDGKGRATDNAFVERIWRTVKYEYIYLHAHLSGIELHHGLKAWFDYYNTQRRHQSLDGKRPW